MLVVRKLLAVERWKLRDHLLRLAPHDRQLRFRGTLSDHAIAVYCDRGELARGYVSGCFIDGVLRGAAELHIDGPHFSKRGEVAFSVETPWQNQGIASELLRRTLVIARNRSVRTLYMTCLLDNRPMQRVARKFSDDLRFRDGDVEADIVVPFPSYLSLGAEAQSDGRVLS